MQQQPSLFHTIAFRRFLHQCQFLSSREIHKAARPLAILSIPFAKQLRHPTRSCLWYIRKYLQKYFLSHRNKVCMVIDEEAYFKPCGCIALKTIFLFLNLSANLAYLFFLLRCCLQNWLNSFSGICSSLTTCTCKSLLFLKSIVSKSWFLIRFTNSLHSTILSPDKPGKIIFVSETMITSPLALFFK